MTVASTVRRNVYNYIAGQTVFPFTFPVLEKSHIEVYRLPTGQTSPTLLVNGVDYTVFGEGLDAGGNVTLAAPTVGTGTLTIIRVVPLTQPTDFKNQGSFFPRTHERAFDRVTMLAQQIAETLSRSLTLPINATAVDTELPFPQPGALLGWDAGDLGIRNFTPQEIATTVAFGNFRYDRFTATAGQTVFTLAADPGAIGNLDVSINGVTRVPIDDYTLAGTTLTLTGPMTGGERVLARYGTAAGATDASVMTWQPAGVGAAQRTVQDKLRETVSVKDFGAVGDGVANDTAAIQAAIDSLGAAGGAVEIPNGMRCLIDTALTIKPNVSLVGPHEFVGSPQNNHSAPYGSLGGALIINSGVTVTLRGGASVSGLLVYRKGMTFPAAGPGAFAGTALTVGGDDAAVSNSMILGFNRAILSNGWQRGRFYDLLLDNVNGIRVTAAFDIPRIENVHCWPFATIAQYAIDLLPATIQRGGTAFDLEGVSDWVKLTNCFAYGYFRGFDLNNVNTPTLVSCTVDGTPPPSSVLSGSRGFSIRGTTYDAKLIGCQAASQEIGFYLDTSAGIQNQLTNCIAWNGTNHAFFVGSGDWMLTGCGARQYVNGLIYTVGTARVTIRGFQFGASLTNQINLNTPPTTGFVDFDGMQAPSVASGGSLVTGVFSAPSIASAQPLPIPAVGSAFNITGTTNFGNLQSGWAGREVTLFFAGALTVVSGTGAADTIRLSGGSNFTTAAGSTLTLRHNGTQWFEVGRSA